MPRTQLTCTPIGTSAGTPVRTLVARRHWLALALLTLAGCDRPAGLPPAPSPAPENSPRGLRVPALPGSAPSRPAG